VTVHELYSEGAGAEDAPPMLMGGSLGSTLEMWDPQVAVVSQRARVVRFDHRGHGRSPVPAGPYTIEELGRDVLGLLDRLQIPQASYCGLSIGGMVGMWLGAHAPERIDRLVLICTSAVMPNAAGYGDRAATVRAAGTVEVIADTVIDRWFTPDFAEQNPEMTARYRAMLVSTPAEGYAGCCEAIDGLDLRDDLPLIRAPTLVIAGTDDPATPPERGSAIADAVSDARLCVLDRAAHLANVQQADEVTRLISDHLDSSGGNDER
jgi:3-oxoadipate enol-lactonase